MATMLETLQADLTTAMKARKDSDATKAQEAEVKLGALREALTALSVESKKGKGELDDAGVRALLRKLVKSTRENAQAFKDGGAEDRAQAELARAEVLDGYLPQQASAEATQRAVEDFVAVNGLAGTGMKSMGVIVKHFGADESYDKALVAKYAKALVA